MTELKVEPDMQGMTATCLYSTFSIIILFETVTALVWLMLFSLVLLQAGTELYSANANSLELNPSCLSITEASAL